MHEMTMPERMETGIKILNRIDEICSEHSVVYYLAYGTLLGAVRHRGFIPWDDDIDIWVPIGDFERLLGLLKEKSGYWLLDHFHGESWLGFSKLCDKRTVVIDNGFEGNAHKRGIAVDIFPLYGCDKNCNNLIYISKLRNILFDYEEGYRICGIKGRIRYLLGGVSSILGKNELFWRQRLLDLQMANDNTKYVGCPNSVYGKRDIHNVEDFKPIRLKFEDNEYLAPAGFDHILTDLYGNYMTLPPKSKQVSNHNVKCYWKE